MKKVTLSDLDIKGKIFCLSMQRSGTSSVGDYLEQYGLKRAGSPLSSMKGWTRAWNNGNFKAIFEDDDFINTDVFEDDPWWCPEFYKYVYYHVPGSKFILLDRDSNSWFKSMIRHSYGYTLGITEIHAKIYRRENEYLWLKDNIPDFGRIRSKEMVLYDKVDHYKSIYERHNREVKTFFKNISPESLFYAPLNDKEVWQKLAYWLNLPTLDNISNDVHAHKAKEEFKQEHLLWKRQ